MAKAKPPKTDELILAELKLILAELQSINAQLSDFRSEAQKKPTPAAHGG